MTAGWGPNAACMTGWNSCTWNGTSGHGRRSAGSNWPWVLRQHGLVRGGLVTCWRLPAGGVSLVIHKKCSPRLPVEPEVPLGNRTNESGVLSRQVPPANSSGRVNFFFPTGRQQRVDRRRQNQSWLRGELPLYLPSHRIRVIRSFLSVILHGPSGGECS